MVTQNRVRTYGVNQVFQLVEGIWLHGKGRQIRKRPILLHKCATFSELPSCTSTMLKKCEIHFTFCSFCLGFRNGPDPYPHINIIKKCMYMTLADILLIKLKSMIHIQVLVVLKCAEEIIKVKFLRLFYFKYNV